MADELVLKLKVETTDGGQKLEDVNQQMDKIKKNAKETSDGFKVADTSVGKMWSSFKDGASKAITSMSSLKGAIIATGIGALVIAVAAVYQWFQKTEQGARILAGATEALGQAIKEGPILAFNSLKFLFQALLLPMRTMIATVGHMIQVFKGKESLKEAVEGIKTDVKGLGDEMAKTAGKISDAGNKIAGAYKNGVAWEELMDRRRENLIKESLLESQVAQLREEASDADTKATEKVNLLSKAKALLIEKNKTELQDAEDKVKLLKENAARNAARYAEWNDKLATAEKELNDVRTKASNEQRAINKAMKAANTQEASEAKKRVEDEKKNQQEIQDIRNETVLATLDGQEKEQTAIDQTYAKEYQAAEGNAEKQQALDEKHIADSLALQDKYIKEEQKAEKEASDKAYEQKQKDLKDAKDNEEKKLEAKRNALSEQKNVELEMNAGRFEQGLETYQEYLENERDLRIQQIEIEITDEEEKQAKIDKIKAEYDSKDARRKQDLRKAIQDAAMQVAQAGADAIFSVENNNLNKRKEAELSNKNLTEAQKTAISKKYAQKQKELDMKQAVINGALAILSGFLTKPFVPAGIIAGALATTLAGIQIATIAKTQYGQGGILQGKSHANGGINLGGGNYAEGGEGIISAANMKNPMISNAVVALSTKTIASEQSETITADTIIAGVVGAIKSIPVVVSEHRISLAQNNVAVREKRFSIE